MGFWDRVNQFTQTVSRALPPCHVCGAPGGQICRECGRVGCYRHAYTNVGSINSVCSACMASKFDWAADDLRVKKVIADDWPYSEAPWDILGIQPGASVEEIRKAQRAKSAGIHPDITGSAERQVAVNRAADEMIRMGAAM